MRIEGMRQRLRRAQKRHPPEIRAISLISIAYAKGKLDAATLDDESDTLVTGTAPGIASQIGRAVLGVRERFRASTERVVAELRVHRLAHASG